MTKNFVIMILLAFTVNIVYGASSNKLAEQVDEMLEAGNIVGAEAKVDSAMALSPDDHNILTSKGNVLSAKELYSEALGFYESALEHKSKHPDALYGAGWAALKTGQLEKALGYFERGVDTKKRKSDFLYGQAIAQKELGQLAEADKTIRTAISKDKKNPVLHRALGDINFAKEVWSIAISEYKETLKLDSTQTDLYYQIAKGNFFSRNFTEAVKWYKDYLKIYDSDINAWKELAAICKAANLPGESIFCYQRLVQLEPDNGEYWYTLGDLHYGVMQYDSAGAALEKAVGLEYNVAESYKRLAKVYQLRQDYNKADSAYTRYESEMGEPDDPEYWFDKGKVMIKIGQKDAAFFERAKEAFDKAIRLDSANSSYWEYGGLARYYKQEYATAIPYFDKRIELGTENVNALRNKAICLIKTEKYNEAAATLEKAIELKPDDAVMRKMIGKIYIFLSRGNDSIIQKAIPHLKIALQNTEGSLSASEICEVRGDLGYCYVALAEPKNAIPYLERAVQCSAKDVDYLFNLASAYHMDNQTDKANEYYNKVLDIDPNHKGAKEGALRTTRR